MRRFLCPDLPAAGGEVWLDDAEAHHLLHVLRAAPGDACALFDGRGREVAARVVRTERRRALLEVVSERDVPRIPRAVTLCPAVPRGQRMEYLVEKCAEAGVARVLPVAAARSVRQKAGSNALRRWRRAALEAAKQCGRADVPTVAAPAPLASVVAACAGSAPLVALPGAAPPTTPAGPVALFVGPEGGYTDAERALLDAAGATPFGLGDLVLRVETAAVIAVHAAVWG